MKMKKAVKVGVAIFAIFILNTAAYAVSEMLFPDVEEGSWYEDAANWAGEAGLITGIDGNFVPEGNVTRAQLATIMYRYDMYMMDKMGMAEEDDTMEEEVVEEEVMEYDYTDLTASEAKDLIDTTPELIVVDVSPHYADGHVPGAVNYPVGDGTLDDTIPTLDTEAMYLVYCHGEEPSRLGAQKLVDAGFTNVYRLEGNYSAWVDAGYDIET
ncbi:hypothetical protein GF354_04700 [Candidatus Peregrinibacteria bacterium]|nr:hypothetical protein [Candidatus Peregrinibacteria bacterium]